MFTTICKRLKKSQKGFTLIELLVVIIIIAILAAIAIPTFLGQRQKAQDASAKSLVRNAMTAVESAYVDARSYNVAGTVLGAIEPSITWNVVDANMVTASGTYAISSASKASASTVDFWGGAAAAAASITSVFSISTESDSENVFGVYADKGASGATKFVKDVGGTVTLGW